jgi:hypothetical protein
MTKKFFTIFLLLSLCACGFQVIYRGGEKKSDISYVNELAAIRIKKDRVRINQELKNNLYDILNPDYIKVEPKYFLTLEVSETITPTFITITGSSGRNKITLTASYVLKNLATAETISEGHTSVNDNYDVTNNRYGSYTAENYVRSNLTKIAAQNTRNSLVNDFIELKQKCEEKAKSKYDSEFICPLNK